MINKKKILAQFISATGLIQLYRRLPSKRLIIFNYHRIRPDDPSFSPGYDEDVFGPCQSEFKRQMKWLMQNANIISEDALLDYFDSGRISSGMNVMITFDDGYIDNYTLAYPVLKELGIPALFFIPTGLIGGRRLGWWDIAAFLIKNTGRTRIDHYGHSFDLERERRQTIRYFHSILEFMKPAQAWEFLGDLAEYCDVPFPGTGEQSSELMNWDQIRAASKNGITIGSHTHTHPNLSTLSRDDQKKEMMRSASILEEQTGKRIRSIAYPIGGSAHISADTGSVAAEAGYRAGFSYQTGINHFGKINRYDVKRTYGPNDLSLLFSLVLFPAVFSWEKRGSEISRGSAFLTGRSPS